MRITKICQKCNKEMENVYHTKRYCEDCILILNKESHKKAELKRIGTRLDYKKNWNNTIRKKQRESINKINHKELICSGCSNIFMQHKTNQKYCKISCMKKNHHLKNIERYNKLSKLRYEKYKEENPNYTKEQYKEYVNKENERRSKLGLPLVGQRFLREMEMFAYLNLLFPNEQIIFHDRTELNGLELDAFLSSLKLAFEYMGRQHFEEHYINSIYITSEEEFEAQKIRDQRKIKLCKEKGIILIHINYNEKLSEQLILQKLNEKNVKCIQNNLWRPNK